MTATLESLEARFADLQRKILGDGKTVDDVARENSSVPIADLLLEASSTTTTALSGREKVNSMVPRMCELDRYLDPTFEDSIDVSALVEVLLSAEPGFRERCEQLETLGKLAPVLDSEAIGSVATHGDRIERLLVANLEKHDLTEECCAKVYKLVEEYNAIVVNITKTLVQWDDVITQIELERKPKKIVE